MAMGRNDIAILLILLSLQMVSCAHKTIELRDEKSELTPIDDLALNGIIINLDADENQLVQKLGRPKRVETNDIDNPYYDEFDDASISYYYPGLEIIYYYHKHPEYGWKAISQIEVTSNEYKLKYNIKMGMDVDDVVNLFGVNQCFEWESEGKYYISFFPTEKIEVDPHVQIIFVFKDERLIEFSWSRWP